MEGYHNETVRDKYYFGRDFVTIFTDDLNNLLSNGELKFDEWKVLLYLIANLQKNNMAITNLDIISQNVGIDRTRVSRSLTGLKRRNIIVEMKMTHSKGSGPVTSIFQISLVNPNLCFNGQTKNYKKEVVTYPKLTKQDGQTLLNSHAEAERQKLIRQRQAQESLFPEAYEEEEELSPEEIEELNFEEQEGIWDRPFEEEEQEMPENKDFDYQNQAQTRQEVVILRGKIQSAQKALETLQTNPDYQKEGTATARLAYNTFKEIQDMEKQLEILESELL